MHKKLISARDDTLVYFRELVAQKRNYRRLGFEQDATDLISVYFDSLCLQKLKANVEKVHSSKPQTTQRIQRTAMKTDPRMRD